MANFPTAPTTFANRSAGQSVASAHMNSVQDEIAAIEDGYLNGTARLNSSRSTVATLSVLGNSTFAAAINVGGNSTFGANVQFGSNSSFAGPVTITSTSVTLTGPLRVHTDLGSAIGSSGSTGLSLGRPGSTGTGAFGSTSQVAWMRIHVGTGANSTYWVPLFR